MQNSRIVPVVLIHFCVFAVWFICVAVTALCGSQALADQQFEPLDPGQVKVGGEIGRRIDITINNNLLKIDVEKDFLQSFRNQTSTPKSTSKYRYVGLGKLIDSAVSFVANTDDPRVVELKDHLIDELLKTQLDDGYIGLFKPEFRISAYWDLHEMVYLIFALVADYERCGTATSLQAAQKLGDYVIEHHKNSAKLKKVGKLNTERAFLSLHRATGKREYLDYAVNFGNLHDWQAQLDEHAYTTMNICLSQLDLFKVEKDKNLLAQSHRILDFLQAHDGLIISGTCSRKEKFRSDQVVKGNLGETCATAYLIRLLHNLLVIEGKPSYGDIMERGIFNALFAAQLPDGRRLRYFTPLEGRRPVYDRDTYCCPCNFRRIIAELPQMVYYQLPGGGLAVNLYGQSSATLTLGQGTTLGVRQDTDYPNSGKIVLHLDPSRAATFPLWLRIPAWCDQAGVSINGKNADKPARGGRFWKVERQWKPGDRVEIEMPISWRLVRGRKAQQGRVAVMRGPVLYCCDPQRLLQMNPALAKRFGYSPGEDSISNQKRAELTKLVKQLILDPNSLGEPIADATVRPDGLACPARAWSPGTPQTKKPDIELLLTEFPDPAGEATYFCVPNTTEVVDDELMIFE